VLLFPLPLVFARYGHLHFGHLMVTLRRNNRFSIIAPQPGDVTGEGV
jgi:hypothetical protein